MGQAPRPRRTSTESVDAAGPWFPATGWLAIAVGLVAGGVVWCWPESDAPALAGGADAVLPDTRPQAASAPSRAAARPQAPAAASGAVPGLPAALPAIAAPRIARQRDPGGDLTPDLSDYVNEGEAPTMGEVISRLHQAGVTTGLGAFSPPGTRPPLVGLAVPENFVLPPGYVRHYQATDEGRRIEPILMFSPDHPPLDVNGQPIPIPEDRVVPPELAPPGLPIRRIVVPAPAHPRKAGS